MRSPGKLGDPAAAAVLAGRAASLAPTNPTQAQALARQARRDAGGDPEVLATAERALGHAARELHDVDGALAHLRQAVRVAERHDLALHAAQARVVLAGALAQRGDLAEALREADRAAPVLRGRDLGRLLVQRGVVLDFQGRIDEALEAYRRAFPVVRRAGDRLYEAKLLNNRGMLHSLRGGFKAAETDLLRAERLYTALDLGFGVTEVRQNLGYVAALRGDLPSALGWFEHADTWCRAHGIVDALGLRDRCEALLLAGLVVDARRAAEVAVRQLGREGRAFYLAEARLLLSEAALLDGDPVTAGEAAVHAKRAFARQGRPRWVALARYAELRAAGVGRDRHPGLLPIARRAAATLQAAGWTVPAVDAHLIAGQLALDLRRRNIARRELTGAARARRRGPADLRSRAWRAEALLRLTFGDRRGAESALRAGMGVLDRFRAALGATELRAHVSGHAAELARLGLRLAIEDGDPRRVLAWAERWRASSLRLRPVRPPDDRGLEAALAELRRVVRDLDEAVLAGRDTTRLHRRQAALERAVQLRARQAAGEAANGADTRPPFRALAALLGERALVELVELDGRLWAAVVAGGRARLRLLGDLAEVARELESLRFGLRRRAFGHGSARSQDAAEDLVRSAARRLDELLLGPLAGDVTTRPLVLVPTGVLHALPWAALPSLAGRPVSVAPSAALWFRAASQAGPTGRGGGGKAVLVAGPGLAGASDEIAALAPRYPWARCLAGPEASAEAVAAALDGAELAHVAAHGHFRVDNPLFSSLQLADGPLTVYDLEGLSEAPACLVLSACDSGLSGVRPGDELMGLAGALFALGTRTLIASVLPVPDAITQELTIALHEELQAGRLPAEALAHAQALVARNQAGTAVSASFVCFGAG